MGNQKKEAKYQNNPIFYKNPFFSKTGLLILLKFIHGHCHLICKLLLEYRDNRIENKTTCELP